MGTHSLWHLHILVHDVHLILFSAHWMKMIEDVVLLRSLMTVLMAAKKHWWHWWMINPVRSRWLNEILTGNQWPIRDQGGRISIMHPVLLDVTAISPLLNTQFHHVSPSISNQKSLRRSSGCHRQGQGIATGGRGGSWALAALALAKCFQESCGVTS